MQSRKGQINRLLTSIMASMVVLSAMASVELSVPQPEVEQIVNQLRTDCTLLLSHREGQEALGRMLRHPKGRALAQAIKKLKHIGVQLHGAHFAAAYLSQNSSVAPSASISFISITIPPALLIPELRAGLHVRSPGWAKA
ncbi:MAG: hypothetical protein ACI30R_02435 [Sodaliphilus sp.]